MKDKKDGLLEWATERLPDLVRNLQHLQTQYRAASERAAALREQIQRVDAQLALLRDAVGDGAFQDIWARAVEGNIPGNEAVSS